MRSIRSFSVVLTVILVLPGLVAGGVFAACLHAEPATQGCCAMNGSNGDVVFHGQNGTFADAAHQGQRCSCSHLPQPLADSATTATMSRVSEGAVPFAAAITVEPVPLTVGASTAATDAHGPPAEAPPVFLLDCALLI